MKTLLYVLALSLMSSTAFADCQTDTVAIAKFLNELKGRNFHGKAKFYERQRDGDFEKTSKDRETLTITPTENENEWILENYPVTEEDTGPDGEEICIEYETPYLAIKDGCFTVDDDQSVVVKKIDAKHFVYAVDTGEGSREVITLAMDSRHRLAMQRAYYSSSGALQSKDVFEPKRVTRVRE